MNIQLDRQVDIGMNIWTVGRPTFPQVVQMHQMVSGSLALLYFLLGFHGGRQGSGPNRGQSPVEWGDFPFIRLSVRPSIRSPLWAIQ